MALQSTTALATITLQSSSAEVVFSSIPSTYRDLIIVFNATANQDTDVAMSFNGDTNNANYARRVMSADGGSTYSVTNQPRFITYYGSVATNVQQVQITQIIDYSATDKHKTSLSRSNRANSGVDAITNRWASLSPVNQITLTAVTGTNPLFSAGSTFSLYGRIA